MLVHSTCRDCGQPLMFPLTEPETVHPLCTPCPTKAERLAEQWLKTVESGDTIGEAELQAQIDELDSRPPRLGEAAVRYAQWGWPVFPLKPRSKIPATRNGFKDATTNPERIRIYWEHHPQANIGLPTGHAFDVIDIDVPDGPPSLKLITDAEDPITGRGLLPEPHGMVATASGGAHYYIPVQGRGNKAAIMPGIDIRGLGGYVVAPPSTLGQPGRSWSWTTAPSPTLKNSRGLA